jgi:hypothetical protein
MLRGLAIRAIVLLAPLLYWVSRPGISPAAAVSLDRAESLEFFSLLPRYVEDRTQPNFQGYHILGQARITDPSDRQRLTTSLKRGARFHFTILGGHACFSPRHGIRATNGHVATDFVICFECGHVYVHTNSQREHFGICAFPQSTFDALLKKSGLPLAPAKDH